jgi:hypothetical protein
MSDYVCMRGAGCGEEERYHIIRYEMSAFNTRGRGALVRIKYGH